MNSTMTVRLTIIGLFLCALTTNDIRSADGAPITFTYSGVVSSSDFPLNFIPVGTPFSISYTFNSNAPATVTVPGSVGYGSSIVNSTVTIGNMTFAQPNPGIADTRSEIDLSQPVSSGNPLSQRYEVLGSAMGSLVVQPNLTVTTRRWGINLTYETAPGFPNFDLPLSQPRVPDGAGYGSITFCEQPTGSCLPFNVIATLTPVPLPGAAYLFLSGLSLAGLAEVRRRKSASDQEA